MLKLNLSENKMTEEKSDIENKAWEKELLL